MLIIALGYPFGYFMAKLGPKWKKRTMLLLMIPFWTSSLIRLYGWIIIFRAGGVLDSVLMALHITSEPLKVLYTYPAVVVGMVYALLPFMIFAVYSSAEKLDFSLVEAARDLGASPMKAFLTVSLKLTLPGLLSGVVLTFVPSMGLFFIADLLGGNKVVLVGNLIQTQLMNAHNWPFAAALSVVLLVLKRPLLYAFGASDATYPYADGYLTIYLLGSIFVMISLGMNQFINAQGFGRTGMLTVLIGAVTNILLDPVFIFVLGMGVQGAALATILSQFLSAVWAVSFLRGKKALIRLEWGSMRLQPKLVWQIVSLGFSSFVMAITNSIVQVACNSTLQSFGGDLYVGVMTIINSVREVVSTPINGVTSAAQPVMGFNYGAQEYRRVRSGIVFTTIVCVVYTTAVWLLLCLFPRLFIGLFTGEEALREAAVPSMHIYFFGFFMMSLQMAGQSAAVALGRSKQAVFFSLFRKVIIVTPLTLLLPHLFGLGVNGVFLAEPISNFIGGGACYITMLLTIWREMNRREKAKLSGEAPQ